MRPSGTPLPKHVAHADQTTSAFSWGEGGSPVNMWFKINSQEFNLSKSKTCVFTQTQVDPFSNRRCKTLDAGAGAVVGLDSTASVCSSSPLFEPVRASEAATGQCCTFN